MKRRRDLLHRHRPRLEVVPMIDIMMFLLVFFVMVVLKMIPDSGIRLKLPDATAARQLTPTKVVVIIDRQGGLFINNTAVTNSGLARYLTRLIDTGRKVNVIVAADRSVRYEKVMQVMNMLRKSGIVDVGLATRE